MDDETTTERTTIQTDAPSSGIAWWHIVIIVLVVCCVISVLVVAVIIIWCKHRNRPITVIQPVPSSSSNNKRRKRTASQKIVVLKERPRGSEPRASARQQSQKVRRKEAINILPPSESTNMPTPSETVAAPPLMSVEPASLSREKVTGTSKVPKRRQEISSTAGPGRGEVERDNTADDKESEAVKNDEPPYFPATKIPSQRQLSESNEI